MEICTITSFCFYFALIFAEEEEVENLQEEANLPLGELLTRFGVASKKNHRSLRKKANREDLLSPVVTKKKPVFPLLNDTKITNGSGVKGEEKINSGSENKTVETVAKEDKGSELVKHENGTSSNGTSKTHSTDEEELKEETDSHKLEDSEKVVCNGKNEIPEIEKGELKCTVIIKWSHRLYEYSTSLV